MSLDSAMWRALHSTVFNELYENVYYPVRFTVRNGMTSPVKSVLEVVRDPTQGSVFAEVEGDALGR